MDRDFQARVLEAATAAMQRPDVQAAIKAAAKARKEDGNNA